MASGHHKRRQWMQRHVNDPFVKRSQQEGYRSRAVYKLQEIDQKDRLLRKGMNVVDLGAAPGGWSQYVQSRVGPEGRVFALDILPMDAIPGVEVIEGDFTEDAVLQALLDTLRGEKIQLVISDMAPNISGIKSVDQAKAMYLAELALDLAHNVLEKGGDLLVKVFQGEGFDAYLKQLRQHFVKVQVRKPKASRASSRETYLLARSYRSGSGDKSSLNS